MAPIRFEEQIKEQLDKRRLEPSAGSWDKLSSELDKAESESFNGRWWAGLAAAVTVLLVIGTFVFRQAEVSFPEVADEPTAEEKFEKPAEKAQFQPAEELASEEAGAGSAEKFEETRISEESFAETKAKEPETRPVKKTGKSSPVVLESIAMSPPEEVQEEATASENTSEVIADASEEKTVKVTDAEVDALLALASERIEPENSPSGERITAEALLSEVEAAGEESTKTKVFQLLKEGYLKAKTSIVQRND